MSRFWLATGVAVWLSLISAAPAAELPKGTFTASPQKDWSIRFDGKGHFTVLRGRTAVVEGSYKASDTELTLTDEKGPFAAKEKDARSGKYRWKYEKRRLTFTAVEDKSRGRELLLTTNAWLGPK